MLQELYSETHYPYPIPVDEAERLEALYRYDILDTPDEEAFDRLTALAARILGAPIALITLIDDNRQWFKSAAGLPAETPHQTPRSRSFCAHALAGDGLLCIPDTTRDARFARNPLVTGPTQIRFYAGAPLTTHDGHTLGTFCVLDRVPHAMLDAEARATLEDLATVAMALIEQRIEQRLILTAERMKDEFISNVSHELRTPLAAIAGALSLMESEALPDLAARMRQIAASNAARLTTLVNDILDIERLTLNRLTLNLERFDLALLISEVAEALTPYAAPYDVRFALNIAQPVMLIADEGRVAQVLTNLMSNAAKFSPQGGTVTVSLQQRGDYARIAVSDRGCGIAESFQPFIFEKFAQAAASQMHGGTGKGSGKSADSHKSMHEGFHTGVGLGLSIAKMLVEAHRGTIGYNTRCDGAEPGTTFWFELPLANES